MRAKSPTASAWAAEPFRAVSLWYVDFSQTGDEEVPELLRRAEADEHMPVANGVQVMVSGKCLVPEVRKGAIMAELQLTLTEEERAFLVGLLEITLKDMRIEEHRTRTPSYREHILDRENLITRLLDKLHRPSK
jgi:hypothetical protein